MGIKIELTQEELHNTIYLIESKIEELRECLEDDSKFQIQIDFLEDYHAKMKNISNNQ